MATIRYDERRKCWFGIIAAGKKRIWKKLGPDKRIAKIWLDQFTAMKQKSDPIVEAVMKDYAFALYIEEYRKHIRHDVAESTRSGYELLVRRLEAFALRSGIKKMSEFSLRKMEIFKEWLRDELKPEGGTLRQWMQMTKTFFSWGYKTGRLASNPASRLANVKGRPQPRKTFSEKEVQLVIDNLPRWKSDIFEVLIYSGMRRSEAETLRWKDVDFSRHIIHVGERPEWGFRPKTGQSRDVPMHPRVEQILTQMPRNGELVFTMPGSDRPVDIYTMLKRTLRKLGLGDRCVHSCRHTFASQGLANGIDLKTVSEMLGHSQLSTTAVYLHTNADRLQSSIQKLSYQPDALGNRKANTQKPEPPTPQVVVLAIPTNPRLLK